MSSYVDKKKTECTQKYATKVSSIDAPNKKVSFTWTKRTKKKGNMKKDGKDKFVDVIEVKHLR